MEILADNLDRLITVEMRIRGLPAGHVGGLYKAARDVQKLPLTYLAARQLLECVKENETVLIMTGGYDLPNVPRGETDGHLGVCAIARALIEGLDARIVYGAEERCKKPILEASSAIGIARKDVRFVSLPVDEGELVSMDLIERFSPSAVITIEMAGRNEKGVIHSITGRDCSRYCAKADLVVEAAKGHNILTIGIGDGGNEIGFGMIKEVAENILPFGKVCQCPCRSGIVSNTASDILVVASVSNWGAYGIEAVMAAMLEDLDILHTGEQERKMLEANVGAGAHDGVYGKPFLMVDGIDLRVHQAMVDMMREMVSNFGKSLERSF